MKRETAWRIFAGEYNDSKFEIKSEGEMMPSYIVTPLGAKINRVFVIGVLTDVENITEGGDLVRAHISDPTGVFTLYSGSYQKEVTDSLSDIQVPSFVAVIGKVRTYTPEEGTFFVSIRPEKVMEVTAEVRDKWILETCRNTKDRIEALIQAIQMNYSDEYELRKLGYSKELSEGIIHAKNNYGDNIDLNKYVNLIQESLQYLVPGKDLDNVVEKNTDKELLDNETFSEEKAQLTEELQVNASTVKSEDESVEESKESEETEKIVLEIIKEIEGEEGAAWDKITQLCEQKGLDTDSVEESLNSLMDKGLIYEPILGTIKST